MAVEWKDSSSKFLELVKNHTSEKRKQRILENSPMLWACAAKLLDQDACPVCGWSVEDYLDKFIDQFRQEHWTQGDATRDSIEREEMNMS